MRETARTIRLSIRRRADGGLRVWSEDIRGLYLSHSDAEKVMADILPALDVLWPPHKESADE